jgi:hypothetical protein
VKNLSKNQDIEIDELISSLEEHKDNVNTAILNANIAINNYNAVLSVARNMASEVSSSIEEYTSNKSDNWQQSDKGQSYETWLTEWQSIILEDIEEITEPALDHAQELENLPRKPDSF